MCKIVCYYNAKESVRLDSQSFLRSFRTAGMESRIRNAALNEDMGQPHHETLS